MPLRVSEWLPLAAILVGLLVSRFMGLPEVTITFFTLFAVLASGNIGGRRLFASHPAGIATFWGTVSALALLMLLRGAWFYFGSVLDAWGDVWTTVGLVVAVMGYTCVAALFGDRDARSSRRPSEPSTPILEFLMLIVSLAGFLLIARSALLHATDLSIRTPWPFMPWWTLPVTGALWALTLIAAWRIKRASVVMVQALCAIGATVVITPLLYVIGYGFDGFLHVAGETVLAHTGTLLPKPPYYMGQYVFVTWIATLFDLSIAVVDRWLVPVTAMVLIPAAGVVAAKLRGVTIMAALILVPIGALVATTPHGFATVLALAALILLIGRESAWQNIPVVLLALWAALTHPLIGLPVLIGVLAAMAWRDGWMKWTVGLPLAILAGIAVPLVFGLSAHAGSSTGVAFDLGKLVDAGAWSAILAGLVPWVPNRFALWPQAGEWIVQLLPWIVVVMAGIGMVHGHRLEDGGAHEKRGDPAGRPSPGSWAISSASTFLAALGLNLAGDFGFLIDYERGNYADRLFMVAWLLLLPIAIPELARRLEMARNARLIPKIAVVVAIALLGAGAAYAALPRHDAVVPSRGWSVGRADIDAVKLIDQDAAGEPYTVLANQSVSAAAVNTFGFKRYNQPAPSGLRPAGGDVFFYPIPTGGKLYDVFLRASYDDPSRDTMRDAARLGGSDLVYFVVNDYWWDFGALTQRAASSTDRVFDIQNGKVEIFKYDLAP